MNAPVYSDNFIRAILYGTNTIAMIGASPSAARPSHGVMKYLQRIGYKVIPVNPLASGTKILGEVVYAALQDIPHKIEMVNIFRNPDAVPSAVEQAILAKDTKSISTIWMQLGVFNDHAAHKAEASDLKVVMDRCIKIEHARLNRDVEGRSIPSQLWENSSK